MFVFSQGLSNGVKIGRALLSPDTFLTKIWIVSAGSGETERDDGDEERIL